jgi:hemolysin activation/secretion protein
MKIIRKGFCLSLFGVVVLAAAPAMAQTQSQIDQAAQQSERIQREQMQRQQEDINRSLETNRPQTTIEVQPPRVPQGHGTGCRDIDHIRLVNAVHMSSKQAHTLMGLYVGTSGRCLGVDEIQKLLSDITRFYVDRGYATTRVYLPAQDLTKGMLLIQVVPGKVGTIEIDKGAGISNIQDVFPGVVGEDLNLRDIEQGIDQLNRLTSNNASIDLRPGAQPGESVVLIKNVPTKFWHANLTGDNYGTRSTGRDQLGATVSLDNLTGLNDFMSLTQRNTVPFGDSDKQSTSTSFLLSIPYGYTTFTAGLTASDYDSGLATAGGSRLHLSGDDRAVFATVDHVVYRDQNGKASIHATLTNDKTDSYIDDQKLSVSSRALTFLDLGASYNTALWGGFANIGFDYTRGLNLFDALNDPSGLPGAAPRAQFDKFGVTAGYSHPLTVAKQSLTFSTQFSGQYAPDTLYGSQQFSVGGMYTVRGFYEEELANDDGFYLRNDLTLNKTLGSLYGNPVGFRPFVAFDVGAVGSRTGDTSHGALGGAAIGFDLAGGPVDFNLYTGYPLIYPKDVTNERFNTFARLSVTF